VFSILAGRAQGTELSQRFCTRKLLEALARIALAVATPTSAASSTGI